MCGLTVIYSRIMGTTACFSQWATTSMLSCSIWSTLTWPAWCSLNITAAPPGDSLGADVSGATSPPPSPLPSCHMRLVLVRNLPLAFCCVVTRQCVFVLITWSFNVQMSPGRWHWWTIILVLWGVWPARCFQDVVIGNTRYHPNPHLSVTCRCSHSRSGLRCHHYWPRAAPLLERGTPTLRGTLLPEVLPSPLV